MVEKKTGNGARNVTPTSPAMAVPVQRRLSPRNDSDEQERICISVLATAQVRIIIEEGVSGCLRALCDSGSQLNLITKKAADRIGLPRRRTNIRVSNPLCTGDTKARGIANAGICSRFDTQIIREIHLIVVNEIPHQLPSKFLGWYGPDNRFADPEYHTPGPIDMILSSGVWASVIDENLSRLPNGLLLQGSRFSYLILGDEEGQKVDNVLCCATMAATGNENIMSLISKLWEIEQDPNRRPFSAEERFCQDNFMDTYSRSASGRYIVTMPLRRGLELGDSRANALRRFYALESKLSKDAVLAEKYVEFMREYERLGHMRKVDPLQDHGGKTHSTPRGTKKIPRSVRCIRDDFRGSIAQ